MWRYEKRLQYPVNITNPNPQMAQFIMSQYGGPYSRNRSSIFPLNPVSAWYLAPFLPCGNCGSGASFGFLHIFFTF